MTRKHWQAVEMAFYLTSVALLLGHALAGLYVTPSWHL